MGFLTLLVDLKKDGELPPKNGKIAYHFSHKIINELWTLSRSLESIWNISL